MMEINLKRIFTRIALLIIAFLFYAKCYFIITETKGTSAALGGFFEMFIIACISTIVGFIILFFIGWRNAKIIDYILFSLTTPFPIVIMVSILSFFFK
jgi:hypothetical protein